MWSCSFWRSSQRASISLSDGVMSPLMPMRSAWWVLAAAMILRLSTMTPKSMTSKLLQVKTMLTMFLPMSWTSPLAVARMILWRVVWRPPAWLCFSISGCRMATAAFIAFADFTTCGRNIFPSPNRFPTFSMPCIRGPSMISTGEAYTESASPRSSGKYSVMPLTKA